MATVAQDWAEARSQKLNSGFPFGREEPNDLSYHPCLPVLAFTGHLSEEVELVLNLGILSRTS